MQLRERHLRPNQHPVGAILPLQLAGHLMQLREPRPFGVGNQQLNVREGVLKRPLDPRPQLVQSLVRQRRDEHRVGMVQPHLLALGVIQQVRLVEDEQPRTVAGADLLQHRVDRPHVGQAPLLRRGGIDDVQDQIGEDGLLQGRLEGLDQLMRQFLDEADGVGQQVVAAGELDRARGRVEGVEEPVADRDLGPSQGVEQVDLPALV